jgi:hypothetical protein
LIIVLCQLPITNYQSGEILKMNRIVKIIAFIGIVSILALAAGCGGAEGTATGGDMKTIMEKKVDDNLTITLSNPEGKLKNDEQDIMLTFTDGKGNPVEMKAASLNFNMPAMGSMAEMNDPATLSTTDTPGKFKGKVKLQMAGDWIAQISYEGKETGKTTMKVTAY